MDAMDIWDGILIFLIMFWFGWFAPVTINMLDEDFEYWLKKHHKKLYRKVKRGHTELITKEIEDEFVEWYRSEHKEGEQK